MNMHMNNFHFVIARGVFLALVYLELTKANDTNLYNIFIFTLAYVVMFFTAGIIGIDPVLVTNGFITKTVFTTIDERVRKDETYAKSKEEFKN